MKKKLESYHIKELSDEEKVEHLVAELKEDNGPVVTVQGLYNEELKLCIMAMPTYNNLNFYELSGKPVVREHLKKEEASDKVLDQGKDKNKAKDKAQENELSM